MADTEKKPYGDVQYADPKNNKYPIDTEAHCRAAWSYINMPKNQKGYSPEELASIKSKIKAAAKRLGIDISENDNDNKRSDGLTAIDVETRSVGVAIDDVNFGEGIITVVAVPYEQVTQVPFAGGVWSEVFSRSAFNNFDPTKRRVPATASLVVPNPNHEKGHLVGRIIEARSSDAGLITDVKISRTAMGTETLELANDRNLSASVGFLVKDPRRDQELDRYSHTRRIHRAFLDHLAFVAVPAYAGAEVLSVRSEPDLPFMDTPSLNDFRNDPIFRWANGRLG